MEMVLEDIKSVPGVSSVFLFKPRPGAILRQTDSEFSKEDFLSISKTLEKFFSWGTELFADIRQIRIEYDESTLSAILLDDNLYLIILHKSALDQNLFDQTLTKITGQPTVSPDAYPEQAPGEPRSQNRPPQAVRSAGLELAGNPGADSASQILPTLEHSLNKVLGPIAAVIFSDTRQAWLDGADSPGRASIAKLVQMLCEEIGDAEKIKSFKNLVAPHLNS